MIKRYKQGSVCLQLGRLTLWYKPWRPWRAKARKWAFRRRWDVSRFSFSVDLTDA